MDINTFVKEFAAQFDVTAPESFTAETKFRELEEWDSMLALSIIAMVDEKSNIRLTGDDIRNSNTIGEIFEKVSAKLNG